MLAVAGGVLLVMWSPAIYEQFAHSPGNLTAITDYFSGAKQPPQGIRNGARVVAAQFTLTPDWLLGLRGVSPFSGEAAAMHQNPIPVLLLAFVAAGVVAFRRRYVALRAAFVVLALTVVVGAIAAAQIIGAMAEYRLRWFWVVAVLAVAFTLAVALWWTAERSARVARILVAVGAVGAVALSGAGIARAANADPPQAAHDAQVAAASRQLLAHLRPGHEPVLLRGASADGFEDMKGVALALERAGVGVRVPESKDNRLTFGRSRADRHGPVRGLYVVVTDAQIEDYRSLRTNHEVAYVGAVGPAEHARLSRRFDRLQRKGPSAFGPELARLAGRLNAIAIFSVPRFHHDRTN
jgi:hypothetical protein